MNRWISKWYRGFRACIDGIVGMVFPPVCAVCGGEVCSGEDKADQTWKGYGLCAQCKSALQRLSPPFCPRCAIPFGSDTVSSHLCGACMKSPPRFSSSHALVVYGKEIFPLLHRMKYAPDPSLARFMGALLAMNLGDELEALKADLIIPIPLHAKRLRERGFNQSVVLARELSHGLGIPLDLHSLKRIRATAPQVGLSRSQRAENLRGAFLVTGPDRIKHKRILLVDDVLTTGATANEATKSLLKAGAKETHVVVFARVA